jgi:hypothetical protein
MKARRREQLSQAASFGYYRRAITYHFNALRPSRRSGAGPISQEEAEHATP